MEAIEEIESYKGKTYAQVCHTIFAGKSPEAQRTKALDLIGKLAAVFDSMGSSKLIVVAVKRVRDTEYTGTAYSPLPDIGALNRTVNEVLRESPVERSPMPSLPASVEMREEEYGVTICGDREKIVRDRYFFRALCRQGFDLYSGGTAKELPIEAYALMDDKHKGSYGRAPDDAGRMLVIKHYYDHLVLPARKLKSREEIDNLREQGILNRHRWSRWQQITTEN